MDLLVQIVLSALLLAAIGIAPLVVWAVVDRDDKPDYDQYEAWTRCA